LDRRQRYSVRSRPRVKIFASVYANSPYTEELRANSHGPRLARMMNLPGSIG
jgi:hypothetical protein